MSLLILNSMARLFRKARLWKIITHLMMGGIVITPILLSIIGSLENTKFIKKFTIPKATMTGKMKLSRPQVGHLGL